MAFSHDVPAGKTLHVPTGGYNFVGPTRATLSGNQTLPLTYTDGTPTSVQPIGQPKKVVVDKMAVSEEEFERSVPSLPATSSTSPIPWDSKLKKTKTRKK